MLGKPRAAIYDMRLPQNGRQVLRCASYRRHGEGLSVLVSGVIKIVLAFTEINKFELIFLCDKDVGGLDVPVANTFALEKGAGGD